MGVEAYTHTNASNSPTIRQFQLSSTSAKAPVFSAKTKEVWKQCWI